MDGHGVMRWVADDERAWRAGDSSGVPRLFTEGWPYAQPQVGRADIRAFWRDDDGRTFSVTAEPVWPGKPSSADDEAAEE